MGSSRSHHRAILGCIIEAALEMVIVKKRRLRPRGHRRARHPCSQRGIFRPRGYLLTRNETAFFRVLKEVIPDHYLISCKVRLADIITCSERDWRRGHANRIAQKHADFVISWADSSRIVAAIELDDQSHSRPERQQRDLFINELFCQLGICLIRIPASWAYERETVAEVLHRSGLNVRSVTPLTTSRRQSN